jgi:hypothetical protein
MPVDGKVNPILLSMAAVTHTSSGCRVKVTVNISSRGPQVHAGSTPPADSRDAGLFKPHPGRYAVITSFWANGLSARQIWNTRLVVAVG